MVSKGPKLIEDAKQNYLSQTGESLANPRTSSKTYWTLINTVLYRAKIPIIPPLLEYGLFTLDFAEEAQLFDDYVILQCTTIYTGSEIPQDTAGISTLIRDFVIRGKYRPVPPVSAYQSFFQIKYAFFYFFQTLQKIKKTAEKWKIPTSFRSKCVMSL